MGCRLLPCGDEAWAINDMPPEVIAMADSWDEEELLAALRQVFDSQREPPPSEITEAGKKIFSWHGIGKDLAQLTYDSANEADREPVTRTEAADIRSMTFSSARITIELEFTADVVLGQVVPPQLTTITMQLGNGRETSLAADEAGYFSIRPAPAGAFRLRCQNDGDADVLTAWITV
jgi:hypothetical protein